MSRPSDFETNKTLALGSVAVSRPASEWEPSKMSKIWQSLAGATSVALVLGMGLTVGTSARAEHPGPQPIPGPSSQTLSADGITTFVVTPEGHFQAQNNEEHPPGTNFLNNVYENIRTMSGVEMPNTLPSTPDVTYNLHDGPVFAQHIDPRSPFTELKRIIEFLKTPARANNNRDNAGLRRLSLQRQEIQTAIDILEGNPLPGMSFSGFPMLHYNGPLKYKEVQPILDNQGNVVGGNLDITQIYFDQRIEGDTALIDPNVVWNVPWTITYHVRILDEGFDDFSPAVMYFGDPRKDTPVKSDPGLDNFGMPNVMMDQSYFPMLSVGTEYTVKIKMAPGKYYNLTYLWGWRKHPPRVQVSENANKMAGGKSLRQWEIDTFGANPRASEQAKLAAIGMIGDLAPEKRMWTALRTLRGMIDNHTYNVVTARPLIEELELSYLDAKDRTRLPRGVEPDMNADITLFYVNNTIYGSREGRNGRGLSGQNSGAGANSFMGAQANFMTDWKIRPYNFKTTLLNGDHFPHGYVNVDFGGSRGWENQFQNSDPAVAINPATGEPYLPWDRGGTDEHLQATPRSPDINANPQFGSGPYFTFGRLHWWMNAGGPFGAIMVPPVNAQTGVPGIHKVDLTLNFEPSARIRMYQFDPLHHDVAVYSLH